MDKGMASACAAVVLLSCARQPIKNEHHPQAAGSTEPASSSQPAPVAGSANDESAASPDATAPASSAPLSPDCCDALKRLADDAAEPSRTYYVQAAAACAAHVQKGGTRTEFWNRVASKFATASLSVPSDCTQ